MPATNTENRSPLMLKASAKHWVYGWTHYQMAGQSLARMNASTYAIEVKDHHQWIRCLSGSEVFFTANQHPRVIPRQAR